MDPRATQLAQVLVHHSLKLKKGDKVIIAASDFTCDTLLRECYRLALAAGAFVEIDVAGIQCRDAAGLVRTFYETASEEQLRYVSPVSEAQVAWADAFLLISSVHDEQYLKGMDPQKMSIARAAKVHLSDAMVVKRWVTTHFPAEAMAKNAGMTVEHCRDYYYQACLIDYAAESRRIQALQDVLDAGNVVRIIGPETDLTLGIEGRLAAGAVVGRRNVPDGECFVAPLEDKTEGVITFDLPQLWQGNEVRGVRFEFKGGAIVQASAKEGEQYLMKILDEHPGNRRLGELGIGMNTFITRYMKNLLFDEKIAGTIHLAIGRAYSEERGGGKNWGTVHWDMVKDLRMPGTRVTVDGRVIMKDGNMLV